MNPAFDPTSCFCTRKKNTIPLFIVAVADFKIWKGSAPQHVKRWLDTSGFMPKTGAACLLPGEDGVSFALVTVSEPSCPWDFAGLPRSLAEGNYEAEPDLEPEVANALSVGWALGCYRFEKYKKKPTTRPTLVWPSHADKAITLAIVEGVSLARDLVNTPASDMGPEELSLTAKRIAQQHRGQWREIVGDALLKKNYPMIHAVGRASDRPPRLIDLTWGQKSHPKVTLVGKGVCFDTGGLDIKPAQYMKLMKKDMGGAALVLGLAHVLMSRNLPIRLRVLIPAVENSVAGNAMRPLDVLPSRKGLTVEVGDTDAEGRLILADALAEADTESPDLLIDAATLTGAARVALGTGMPAIFSHRDDTWAQLEQASHRTSDPLWRLPLHVPYRSKLNSKVADISNIGSDGYGGAITAALFLREFVSRSSNWIHMDTMGYNLDNRPGRPPGGEALGLLAFDAMLVARYAAESSQKKSSGDSTAAASKQSEKKSPPRKRTVKKASTRKGPETGPKKAKPRR